MLRQETPAVFRQLSVSDQRWRARLYLIALVLTHHDTYLWNIALANDPVVRRAAS